MARGAGDKLRLGDTMSRKSIDIDGYRHSNPIPVATQIGPLIVSSVVAPTAPGGSAMPSDVNGQLDNLFHHVGEMLAAVGADWRHVVKMSFYSSEPAIRLAINGPWIERFPDPGSRPARHTHITPDGPNIVTCDFLAYVDD
jgi:2-iminobutanoate/2-iminopropanoate deaminase